MRRHKYTKLGTGACICTEFHPDSEPGAIVGAWPITGQKSFEKITKTWFEKDPKVKVLVYENVVLDSAGLGELIFIPWWTTDGELPDIVKVSSTLPDNWHPGGIGWKHQLREIVTDPELFHMED